MQAPTDLQSLVKIILELIGIIIPIIVSLALLSFVWGLVKFIAKAGEKDIKDGKNLMTWGIVALFIMVSLWGIIRFFSGELGFLPVALPLLPQ